MIKLTRSAKPAELTAAVQQQLTADFIQTGQSVWNVDYIKKNLLAYSYNKCCYCETNIQEESKYLEVEHFHHKTKYQNEVMEWENLLPSCKKCNGTKNDHDTVLEPIIEPTINSPNKHLKFWLYRLKGIDVLGKLTISVLDLNNQDRLVKKRFEIGNAIQEQLENLNELIDDYINGIQTSTRRKNHIVNSTKSLMREGLPEADYAATSATIIITHSDFLELRKKLTQSQLWDNELSELENKLNEIAFELQK